MRLRDFSRVIAFVVLSVVLSAESIAPAAAQRITDQWTPQGSAAPVALKVDDPVLGRIDYPPVHATLLPNGRIMLFGKAGMRVKAASFAPTPFDQDPPATVVLDFENVPVDFNQVTVIDGQGLSWLKDETLFCSGHSLMDDGSLFVAGGTLLFTHLNDDGSHTNVIFGMPNATLYSYPTQTWSRVPGNMPAADAGGSNLPVRWYGAVTRLADSRMLLTSGWDYVETATVVNNQAQDIHVGTANRSVETWTAAAGYTSVSTHAHTPPQVWNHDYTHVFQLPYASSTETVLMFGEAGVPVFFKPDAPAASQWTPLTTVQRPNTGASTQPDHGVSSALMPLRVTNGEWNYTNGSVLEAGGEVGSQVEHQVDLYEFSSFRWFNVVPTMGAPRRYPANVLLPDGKVLIVNGYDSQGSAVPVVFNAQYLDPRPPTSFATGLSATGEVRGYHNVALLLPDGRVFVAGGRTASETSTEDEKPNFRYLYPPYMSPRDAPPPRPAITSVPAAIQYGQNFSVQFSGGPISEAVLMGLGSMTHSFDTNQRYVQLAMANPSASPAQVTAPPDRQTAPPGYYMLFVLDQNHVPSVASIVQLVAP
jgi:hypothetical protein